LSTTPPRVSPAHAQAEAIRRLRGDVAASNGSIAAAAGEYAGLVTRALALALDSLIVNGAAILVGVTVGLGISLLRLPEEVDVVLAAIGAGVWIIWSIGYFVFFWSSAGQTPGSRVMRIRVIDNRGRDHLKPRRALLRFIGLCLAAIPLLAGLWMMLWDEQRRCLQDRMARTVVVYVPPEEQAASG
jgi:uncharacterized RDD family membrane protein YckC